MMMFDIENKARLLLMSVDHDLIHMCVDYDSYMILILDWIEREFIIWLIDCYTYWKMISERTK